MTKKRLNSRIPHPPLSPTHSRLPFIRTIVLTLTVVILPWQVYAQQEFFPFAGKVNVKSVHIRAGQSKNFESLGQARLDDPVAVVEKNFSWYKVRLPKDAKSYITSEFVTMISSQVGEVTADRVNVRAGAGINFSVLGQVNEGDRVLITETLDEWIRIRPVPESYGWIREDFIDFVSAEVGNDRWLDDKELALLEQEVAAAASQSEVNEDSGSPDTAEKVPAPPTIQTSFKGVLTKNTQDQDFEYLLVNDQEGTYYLDGFNQLLKPFVNYRVKIEGHLKEVAADEFAHPVVVVSRIQLIL